MAITNSLKRQIDLPVFEWTRFAPAVSSAISCTCCADNSTYNASFGRYIYYLIGAAAFWRYDTWTDGFTQLTSPPTAPATWTSMRFAGAQGWEGRVISATSTSLTIPAYTSRMFRSFYVVIVSGTGAGQRRTITDVAEPVAADSGIMTAINNVQGTLTFTDSTKAWAINQWVGYQVRVTAGPGQSQVRVVLSNTATVITLGDSTRYADNIWCNPAIFSPAIVANSSSYAIESSVATVNNAWTVTPDATSKFRIQSGGILMASSAAGNPFYTMQWYDVQTDIWYLRSAVTNYIAAVGTDGTLERCAENACIPDQGVALSGTSTTLTDTNQSWNTNQYASFYLYFANGTGEGQIKKITSNTATTLTFTPSASGTADSTTNYLIFSYSSGIALSGNSNQLQDTSQSWVTNQYTNYAVRILYGTGAGQILPILSNTATLLTTVKNWTINPDSTSVYNIQPDPDKGYLLLGGQGTTLIHNLDDDVASYGRLYDSGAARQGTAQYGGFKPLAISTTTFSGVTATVTTVNAHGFQSGWSIKHLGATGGDGLTAYNTPGGTPITSVTGATTYTYTMTATPSTNAVFTGHSATTLTDASKSWTTNQWLGYMAYMGLTTGNTPTGQALYIASNTASTLTFAATGGTAPSNGLTRYVITPTAIVGQVSKTADSGIAVGATQSTTQLQDSTKTWVVNIHTNRRVKFTGGLGTSQEATVTSNTANVLTFGAQTLAPGASATTYAITLLPARGIGIELQWAGSTSMSATRGRYMFVPRGGAVIGFDRLDITTDLWSLIPTSPNSEALGQGTMCAYDGNDRLYFTKDVTQRLYYINVNSLNLESAGIYPYTAGGAIIGNRMEVFTTADGLRYLWLNRHSQSECYRTLLYY